MTEDKKYPSDKADRFQLRMPAGLRDRIAAAAEANSRSMNAEIISVLEQHYPEGPTIDDTVQLLNFMIGIASQSRAPRTIHLIHEQLVELKEELEKDAATFSANRDD